MSKITATAGRIVDEKELRAYARCSKFYGFGGQVEPELPTKALQWTVEKIFAQAVRREISNYAKLIGAVTSQVIGKISRREKMLDTHSEHLVKSTILLVDEFLKIFKPSKYLVVMPATPIYHKVGRTVFKLHLSGVLRSKRNQTLHLIDFSPYTSPHAMANDPVSALKVYSTHKLVKENFSAQRPQSQVHVFGVSNTPTPQLYYNSITSNEVKDARYGAVEQMVSLMESDYQYPIVPCPYTCPFKQKCLPGE